MIRLNVYQNVLNDTEHDYISDLIRLGMGELGISDHPQLRFEYDPDANGVFSVNSQFPFRLSNELPLYWLHEHVLIHKKAKCVVRIGRRNALSIPIEVVLAHELIYLRDWFNRTFAFGTHETLYDGQMYGPKDEMIWATTDQIEKYINLPWERTAYAMQYSLGEKLASRLGRSIVYTSRQLEEKQIVERILAK